MKYKDAVKGDVELTHVDTIKMQEGEIERTDEIYEFPDGDFIIFMTIRNTVAKLIPFTKEFFVKKTWMKAIFAKKTEK